MGDFCYALDMRKTIFANGEFYHIYNRGVDKREVFLDEADYLRFLKNLREFNINLIREMRAKLSELNSESELSSGEQLVVIIAYCLNPNHFHLILKQISEKGIEKFMHKISTGYTNYFNKKYKRSGALFQGRFKAINVDSNDDLLYLSAYVNRNYFIHGYQGEISQGDWKYCSAIDYLGKRKGTLCDKKIILDQFSVELKSELNSVPELSSDFNEYMVFLNVNAVYLKEKKELEKYLLEEF